MVCNQRGFSPRGAFFPSSLAFPYLVFTHLVHRAIFITVLPEWRNWQTQQTQNLPGITPRVGSTPSSGTIPVSKVLVARVLPEYPHDRP